MMIIVIRYKKSEKKSLGAFKAIIVSHWLLFLNLDGSFRRVLLLFLFLPLGLRGVCAAVLPAELLLSLVGVHRAGVFLLLATGHDTAACTTLEYFLLALFLWDC
jgi:hypothetical protein